MKRTTLWIWLFVFSAFVALIWSGLYWFYRVPVEEESPEALDIETLGVDENDLVSTGQSEGFVPSIDQPQFESVREADVYLNDNGMGLDVEVDGKHRFYPYQLLVWHQLVNDVFHDIPLLVTYSPLTFTGIVFDLSEQGEESTFHVDAHVWNNNLVMTDTLSGSLWSQIRGVAVNGPRTGATLTRYPSVTMKWKEWKDQYPHGEVLSRDTGSDRDYTRDPYGNYLSTLAIYYPLTIYDARLPAKTVVFGVSPLLEKDGSGVVTRYVYSLDHLIKTKEIMEPVGETTFIVRYDEDLETVSAYRLDKDGTESRLPIEASFWFLEAAAFPDLILYELP